MSPCETQAPELAAHAAGEPATLQLEAHLQGCSACRAELSSLHALLGKAAMPPASELELRALAAQRSSTLRAWQGMERRRRWLAAGSLGVAAAAAALLVALGLGLRHPASPAAGFEDGLAVEALADGPIELAEEESDASTFDPELSPTVFSEEGDE